MKLKIPLTKETFRLKNGILKYKSKEFFEIYDDDFCLTINKGDSIEIDFLSQVLKVIKGEIRVVAYGCEVEFKEDSPLKDSFPVIVCDRNTDLRKVRLYIPFNDVYYEGEVIPKYKKSPLYFAPSCPYKKYPPLRTFPIKEIFGFDTSCPSTTLKTIHDVCDEIYSEAIRLTSKGFNIDDRVRVVEYDTLYFRNWDKFFHIVLDKEERMAYLSPIINHKPPILLEEVRENSLYKRKSFQDFEKIDVFVKDLLDNVS